MKRLHFRIAAYISSNLDLKVNFSKIPPVEISQGNPAICMNFNEIHMPYDRHSKTTQKYHYMYRQTWARVQKQEARKINIQTSSRKPGSAEFIHLYSVFFFNLYFTATGKTNCLDRILVGVRILEFLTQLEKCTRQAALNSSRIQ